MTNLTTGTRPLALGWDWWHTDGVVERRNLPHCSFAFLLMELTKSFPPADDLLTKLQEIDYRKHFHNFMNAVEVFCLYVAAIAVVLYTKWQENDCTERLQLAFIRFINFCKVAYNWLREVAIPETKAMGADLRAVYNKLRTI
jgi:hypothetical protein